MDQVSFKSILNGESAAKLNVGVLGPRACLYSVSSPAPRELGCVKSNLEPEGLKVFADFYGMIKTPGLAVIVVASLTQLHIEYTLAAVQRGICVSCKKAPTKDPSKLGQLMQDLGREGSSKIVVGFVRQCDEQCQETLKSMRKGAVKLVKGVFLIENARHSDGIFHDTVTHDIDLTLSFLGEDCTFVTELVEFVSTVLVEKELITSEAIVSVHGDATGLCTSGDLGRWEED
ncbi:NAD-binding Rossmann fold oxidoreductase family protein [Talaromyces islandicus]|uniref:NAD-binding Rossmann fold oxidoreductase family protein n=1 Tax=Talaromyces islandicus TaxID=28573 RepID=A0A0U1LM24_TALIS|nr:NAD-binding Rossmann fold oxidoreductase family protein [Talaromyces islandicus]